MQAKYTVLFFGFRTFFQELCDARTLFSHGIRLYLLSGSGVGPNSGISTDLPEFAVAADGGQSSTSAQSGETGCRGNRSASPCWAQAKRGSELRARQGMLSRSDRAESSAAAN